MKDSIRDNTFMGVKCMNKRLFLNLARVLFVVLWGMFLLAQHIACFDFFETNSIYLYVEAIVFATMQCFVLFIMRKTGIHVSIFRLCCLIYVIIGTIKALFMLISITTSTSWELSALCVALDALGGSISHKFSHQHSQ